MNHTFNISFKVDSEVFPKLKGIDINSLDSLISRKAKDILSKKNIDPSLLTVRINPALPQSAKLTGFERVSGKDKVWKCVSTSKAPLTSNQNSSLKGNVSQTPSSKKGKKDTQELNSEERKVKKSVVKISNKRRITIFKGLPSEVTEEIIKYFSLSDVRVLVQATRFISRKVTALLKHNIGRDIGSGTYILSLGQFDRINRHCTLPPPKKLIITEEDLPLLDHFVSEGLEEIEFKHIKINKGDFEKKNFEIFAKNNPNIKKINLSLSGNINTLTKDLMNAFGRITHLNLSCSAFNGVDNLVNENWGHLLELNVSRTDACDAFLFNVSKYCPNLEFINLSDCCRPQVSAGHLVNTCTKLKKIECKGMNHRGMETIFKAAANKPNLTVITGFEDSEDEDS